MHTGSDRLLPDARPDVLLLDGVNYYLAAATVTTKTDHWASRMFGDGIVGLDSARGRGWFGCSLGIPEANIRVLGGLSHLALVHSPAVYEQIRRWIAAATVSVRPRSLDLHRGH